MDQKSLPALLEEQWLLRLEHFNHMASEEQSQWFESILNAKSEEFKGEEFVAGLKRAWSCSEFVANTCTGNPEMFCQLVESGDLSISYSPDSMEKSLLARLQDAEKEDDLTRELRQFRNREMVRIVWRDFTRESSLEETTADMTALAEACLQCTLDYLYPVACEAWGIPMNCNGDPQQMVILGMGKMGAWELNVSSDIDLIFTYPESGET